MKTTLAIGAAALVALTAPTMAQQAVPDELTIGMSVTPSTLDVHLSALGSDEQYYRHVYDPLVQSDPDLQPVPALATSWELIDDTTWEFELREGVTFHDGSEFNAEDVKFSLDRLGTVPGSDGLNAEKMDAIEELEIVDPLTIRIHTKEPTPDLLSRLYQQFIISNELPQDVATEDFNSGEAAIGTGPFEFESWQRGEALVLTANEDYWGGAPLVDRIVMREMANDGARVAALLAGDVDMVDAVPPLDVARLNQAGDVNIVTGPSSRTIFLQFNTAAETAPMTTAKGGGALEENPFRDPKVREAISLAVNQDLIVDRVMEGLATVANQPLPEGFEGSARDLGAPTYDVDRARELLAEAGYEDGFATVLACSNDRYINDAKICQAAGQMLAAIGIDATVETMPKSVYFGRMREGEFPFFMLGWGNSQGTATSVLKSVVATKDDEAGYGSWNGGFSDPEVDALIKEGEVLMDPEARDDALAEATALAMERHAVVPLHQQPVVVGMRGDYPYTTYQDEGFRAFLIGKEE
ncbi:ABC transporter substrate-binding protein [Acuticoccus sp.]|uniref:ABC transporter substrate-binding protein n=1 Tax=Acuticoccus sp. TaxID=1904378 RepID=UPI003B5175EA